MVRGVLCLGRSRTVDDGVIGLLMPRNKETAPWGQQVDESAPAFAAFVTYRDLDPKERSIDAVVQKLHKSRTLIGRWSGRWEWVRRIRAYDAHVDDIKRQARESAIAKQSRHIMTSAEVLEGISAHGDAAITDLMNEEGRFDLVDIKKRGLGGLVKSLTFHENGEVRRVELYDAKSSKELMGRYYKLWERGYREIEDDEELARRVLAKLTGTKRHLLPPANSNDVDGELLEAHDELGDKEP
jgi:hypothetical protein